MSMFDGYIPDAPMHCPKCGKPLREWQGKDGPCSLLVWRQGRTQPVGFTPDAGVIDSFPKGHRSRERLPERFKIHTSDCGKHWIDAIGETVRGKWVRTRIARIWLLKEWRKERTAELKRRLQQAGLLDKHGKRNPDLDWKQVVLAEFAWPENLVVPRRVVRPKSAEFVREISDWSNRFMFYLFRANGGKKYFFRVWPETEGCLSETHRDCVELNPLEAMRLLFLQEIGPKMMEDALRCKAMCQEKRR